MSEQIAEAARRRVILMGPFEADLFISRQRKRSLGRTGERMAEGKKAKGYGEGRRKEAKLKLLSICETIGVVDGRTRALALFSLQTGHTMQRAEAYLDELVDAGLIKIEGERIISESVATRKRLEEIKAAGLAGETAEEEKGNV